MRPTAAWLEIVAVTALLLSYIWGWQGAFAGDFLVCLALFLAITLNGHRRRGESARDLGFRLDNLLDAARLVFSWVLPLVLLMMLAGLLFDLHREPPIERLWTRIALMPLFGIAQQYGLLGFYFRRFQEALPGTVAPILAAAVVFAGLHAPNLPVMVMTLAVSLGACWLYRRAPNLWVLGLAHGLLSITVAMFLADLLTSGLKVGSRALH
jgi:membrane protease YdiL (CAAX protease family)